MRKRIGILLLCVALLIGLCVMPVSADFTVTCYNEEICAGGILDMMAFVGESDLSGYTFQWQTDASLGDGHWYDLEENSNYKGTKTSHLQFHSVYGGDYEDWDKIPFRCVITKNGVTKYTPSLYMHIRPSDDILKALKNKGFGLYEPDLTNVTGFYAKDDLTYAANAYAGSNIGIMCGGSSESSLTLLENSDVQLKREIKITENGKYIVSGDKTSYIPYTIGSNAVKIEVNMRIVMAGVDRGIYQTKTVHLTTKKPEIAATAKTKSACSLLRYTYNESEKLASIPKGTNLEVVSKNGSYYQVVYNGFVGYVGTSLIDADLTESKVIEHVELTMAEPGAGNVAPTSITVKPASCFATSVEWYDKTSGRYLGSGDRFIKGHDYQVVIWVSAKEGYQFKLDSSDNMLTTAVLNGNLPCFTSKAYEQVIGKVIDIRYDFNNVQDAVLDTHTQPTQPQHTHTPSAWRTTGAYHYKVCSTCGEFLEQEDHRGGVASCSQKGKCTVCGYEYIEVNEDHSPDTSKWVIRGNMYHYHACKLCGAHCDIGEHVAGPAGTPDAAVVCKDCGYIITPAKGHTHKLTEVKAKEPTCTEQGIKAHYTCDGCSELFADKDGKNTFEDVILSALGHDMQEGKCTRCGYADAETTVPDSAQEATEEVTGPEETIVEVTGPEETTAGATEEEPTKPHAFGAAEPPSYGWILWLCAGVAVAVIVATVVIVTVITKKKKK